MKSLIILALILLPLGLFAKDARVEQLFSVQTIKAKKENKSITSKNFGYVVKNQSNVYDISPRFGGYIEKLYANKIYKRVKKGELLASVYSPEVFKAKEEYLNTYRYTKNAKTNTMLHSARLKLQLLGVSDKEIDEVLKSSKASENTNIYSPIDGYVFSKGVENKSAFNAKQKLFEIVNIDDVWIEVKLFEEDRLKLRDTKRFELHFKGVERVYESEDKFLYPNLDPNIATLTLRLSVDNQNHELFPGMYASVISHTNEISYLTLPSTAVIRKNSKYYVFLAGEFEGEYEPNEVKVKKLDADTYAILDGLKEGDDVVNNALFMLDSDAQINGLL